VLRRPLDPGGLIPWRQFSAHQMSWLCEMASVGALALIALFDTSNGKMHVYRIRDSEDFRRPLRYMHVGHLEVLERMQFRGWRDLSLP
jgi:hypothetical protein